MPLIRAQKESRRFPPSGCGGFRFIPWAFAEARPLAFRPPLGFLPSLRVHAGDLAIVQSHRSSTARVTVDAVDSTNALTGNDYRVTASSSHAQFKQHSA